MLKYPTRWDPARTGLGYLEYYAPHNVYHPGIDFNWGYGRDDEGQPVVAPTDAIIEYVSKIGNNGGLGNYVVLRHPVHNVWTRYVHLKELHINQASIGRTLDRGEEFATLGGTGGFEKIPHLHFEVLTAEGIAFIKDHWRQPYNKYFGGLPKSQVAQMTVDPLVWIENSEHEMEPTWQEQAEQWSKDNEIITSGWETPDAPMSQVRVAASLKKFYDTFIHP